MQGGNGNHWIQAGGENDTFDGGTGADRFVFAAGIDSDRITDYFVGTDALEVSAAHWNSERTQALTSVVNQNVVFSFEYGESLTHVGLTSTFGVLDDVALI